MKAWNIKVKGNHQEIIKKLESVFGSVDGFAFSIDHDKNDNVGFKLRKRVLDSNYFVHQNQIIVKGKLVKTAAEIETDITISFSQHFIRGLIVSIYLVFGLSALFVGVSGNVLMLLPGGIVLAAGIALWIVVKKRFEREIQEYKTLITETLE